MMTDNRKILIAYASHYNSTTGIADAIKEEFEKKGVHVDAKPIKDVWKLDQYDAVIIGSPIQYDKWIPETREFISTHQDILKQMPVAFFFSCMALSLGTQKSKQQGQKYSDYLLNAFPQVSPVSIGQFAGVLNMTKMPIHLRLVFRILMIVTGVKEGDYRDWDAIRTWGKDLNRRLSFSEAAV